MTVQEVPSRSRNLHFSPFHWECFPLKTQEVILTSTNQPTADSKDGGGREADAAQDTEGTRKPSKMN